MIPIAPNKTVASLLIGAAFAIWLFCMRLADLRDDFSPSLAYLAGAASFFLVACFLAETRKITFHSRKSALGLVGLFAGLASAALHSENQGSGDIGTHPMFDASTWGIHLAISLGSYWLALFVIRGFRAPPESAAHDESGDGGN